MSQDRFQERHEAGWRRLEDLLDGLDRRRGPNIEAPEAFPLLYRQVCQHLAVARSRAYSRGLTERLHRLVLRAHQQLYRERAPLAGRIRVFLAEEYPRLVRREWRVVVLSALLFFGPLLGLLVAVQVQPELVYTVLDAGDVRSVEGMYAPGLQRRLGRERESDSDFLMFGYYIRNNTSIGFQTFAGGMLGGLGTVFYLVFNGVYIGAIAGHLSGIGYGEPFWTFVAGHSAPELSAILLSGAAGLRLGAALLAPGRRSRRRALYEGVRVGVRLIYGAAALFLVAAFIEAFWSSIVLSEAGVKYAVGAGLWALLWTYLLAGGKRGAD